MIDLTGQKPFAQGSNRWCFVHPDIPDRCLKVVQPDNILARYRRQSAWKRWLGKSRLDDNRQEQRAHRQPSIQRLTTEGQDERLWVHLPRFYGSVETSLGRANESELIRLRTGEIAPTLESRVRGKPLDPSLQPAIDLFLHWLRQHRILTRNLLPHNLVVTDRDGNPRLFLVDGLGAPAIPQVLSAVPGWSESFIERKIARFHKRLAWEQDPQGLSWEEFQRLG
jgi:hypothetical protein